MLPLVANMASSEGLKQLVDPCCGICMNARYVYELPSSTTPTQMQHHSYPVLHQHSTLSLFKTQAQNLHALHTDADTTHHQHHAVCACQMLSNMSRAAPLLGMLFSMFAVLDTGRHVQLHAHSTVIKHLTHHNPHNLPRISLHVSPIL